MLSPELMNQISAIELRAKHLASDVLAGEYLSAFRGRGMDFDEVREYVPGDDVRAIDWNVTARMRQPFVKIFREEREMTVMLMVDISMSQAFGTGERSKLEAAAELAAVISFLAIRNNDRVGLLVFSDRIERYVPPKKGRGHVWNIIKELLVPVPSGLVTDLRGALDYFGRILKRKSLCFLISDFWAQDYESVLSVIGRRHDLVCAVVQDCAEVVLPSCGIVQVQDIESGYQWTLNTSNFKVRKKLEEIAVARQRELLSIFKRCGAKHFPVSAGGSVISSLAKFLREREHRMVR
jgi:uncharacterized protein (DUF58 family)